MLGVALAKVELNETNFSEVLRLFILSRNAGDPHPVGNAKFHSFMNLTTNGNCSLNRFFQKKVSHSYKCYFPCFNFSSSPSFSPLCCHLSISVDSRNILSHFFLFQLVS